VPQELEAVFPQTHYCTALQGRFPKMNEEELEADTR
jgi:predicted RNA-binding protein